MGKPDSEPHKKSLKRRAEKGKQSRNKKTKLEVSPAVLNLPRSAKECGANWKLLSSSLEKEKKEKASSSIGTRENSKRKSKPSVSRNNQNNKPEIWFDDVPEEEIRLAEGITDNNNNDSNSSSAEKKLVKPHAFSGLTKAIGMDCEMVGTGNKGSHSILARVSLVNQYGKCIYDKHVRVDEEVTDYRTWVSGIRPSDLKGAEEFNVVQREVAEILKGRFLVGHALHNDLRVLYLTHPNKFIRDTADYPPFRLLNNGKTPSLRMLSSKVLGVQVQKGEHSSVQDAQAAMKLYMMHKKQWENEIKQQKMAKK